MTANVGALPVARRPPVVAAAARATGLVLRVVFFGSLVLYVLLPIVALLLYSLATRWGTTILPDGYTLAHWQSAFADSRLVAAFARSFGLAAVVAILDVILVVPAAYWSRVHNPRIRNILEIAAAIPFALPYLVIAFGILTLFGGSPVLAQFNNTPVELVLAHTAIFFPFMYWAVDGALAAAGIERLSEAAETCGADVVTTIRRVVVPNITPGLVTGGILVFAASLGEFAVVQVLIGGNFETVPLWQADAIYSSTGRFAEAAASSAVTFGLLFLLSAIIVYLNRGRVVRVLPGARVMSGEAR